MMTEDKCISCGNELISWERNRAECTSCREIMVETYHDDSFHMGDEEEMFIQE